MRVALVCNEGSGGGTDPSAVAAALRDAGADVSPHPFEELDDLRLEGFERLVIATGDGGIGLAAARASRAGIPLAVVPSGTANAVGAVQAAGVEDAAHHVVLVDGEERFAGQAWQVIVSGTGAFGNGSEIEAADPSDGLLHVTVIHGGPRAALPLRAWGMKRGDLTEQDGVASYAGCSVVVQGADAWNVDGEPCHQPDAGLFSLDGHIDVVVG